MEKTTIQNQNFGIEIELTGITRSKAARTIANYFGTNTSRLDDYYDTYTAEDRKGRRWKAMSDASIRTVNANGEAVSGKIYSCEVVTPILQYDDLADLRAIIGELVEAGAVANESCGIHVHINGKPHTYESVTRLLNFVVKRQDLIYEALNIGDRANRWCKKTSADLFKQMKNGTDKNKASMERIWYSRANDGYEGGINHTHYNETRYHGINLHAFFTKGTIEFRLFNGTTDADKIIAYAQLCLAMSAWAINADDRMSYRNCSEYTAAQKERLMNSVLTHRLGMGGKEFKAARRILTEAFRAA